MATDKSRTNEAPVIGNLRDFDRKSGNLLERIVFNNRILVILICVIITTLLGIYVAKLEVNASFEKMIPTEHPYIQNFRDYEGDISGLGNVLRVIVEAREGTIYDKEYLETLSKINDELFLLEGTDRSWMRSLWTPLVRWQEVTEQGFEGGPVMPPGFDGSAEMMTQLRRNVQRAGLEGDLVADDAQSSIILVPLLERLPSGERLDYSAYSSALNELRARYEGTVDIASVEVGEERGTVNVRMVGFTKLVGDLIDGLFEVMTYFAIAAAIAAFLIFLYSRCLRSTLLVISCSLVGVVWQLGIVSALGYPLNPYLVLVPFLVFAIGVSHASQVMNGIQHQVAHGNHHYVAARYTFRRLAVTGAVALVTDAIGFGVLMVIEIPIIQDLAVAASIGVATLIITNLVLMPVLLSYTGVTSEEAARALEDEQANGSRRGGLAGLWRFLDQFTRRGWAVGAILATVVLAGSAYVVSLELQVGDLDAGAPELRADSRYNRDVAYLNANYELSTDVFAIIGKTPPDGCLSYENVVELDRLAQQLRQVPGVQSVSALPIHLAQVTAGTYEGNPKWDTISRHQAVLNNAFGRASAFPSELFNQECSVSPVIAYLADHKADTLDQVLSSAEQFAANHNTAERKFLPVAGSAGIEAVTNIVVRNANNLMLVLVYSAVAVLCLLAFRSWRAVLVAVIPLAITSILAQALMVLLGIGIKVATLPVIALGVGIGVDYALYLLGTQLQYQRVGVPLSEAYGRALRETGKVVALIGFTLATAVLTWAMSPIKFQADMGILLAFMFLWNMIGALILMPALSHFLLQTERVAKARPALREERIAAFG